LVDPNPLWVLAIVFVTSFQATFFFNTSSSDFSVKSYDRLKFFHATFCQLQIYFFSLQCQDFSIKYLLNQVLSNPKLLIFIIKLVQKFKTLKILIFYSGVAGSPSSPKLLSTASRGATSVKCCCQRRLFGTRTCMIGGAAWWETRHSARAAWGRRWRDGRCGTVVVAKRAI